MAGKRKRRAVVIGILLKETKKKTNGDHEISPGVDGRTVCRGEMREANLN